MHLVEILDKKGSIYLLNKLEELKDDIGDDSTILSEFILRKIKEEFKIPMISIGGKEHGDRTSAFICACFLLNKHCDFTDSDLSEKFGKKNITNYKARKKVGTLDANINWQRQILQKIASIELQIIDKLEILKKK